MRTTITNDPNPFGVQIIPDQEADSAYMVAELEKTEPRSGDPIRMVVRKAGNKLAIFDCVAHGAVTQIGPDVTFEQARVVATAVLAGDREVIDHPLSIHCLALCYVAALVAAERRKAVQETRHAPAV